MTRGVHALIEDPWLATLLRRPAFRLGSAVSANETLSTRLAREPLFVTAKVEADDLEMVRRLENVGFRIVDVSLTFDAKALNPPAEPGSPNCDIRSVRAEDRDGVVALASRAFRFSRFHLDPMLPNTIADRIKAAWASNYFTGARGDAMIVAKADGVIVGFLQLLRPKAGDLVIDLIAVAPEAARQGIASAMIRFATCNDGIVRSLRVGTQAANVASCRLYESLGFRLREAGLVLHHHGTGGRYSAEATA
jgi:ribosomal protein S18 acetylase RimI-like enzyme